MSKNPEQVNLRATLKPVVTEMADALKKHLTIDNKTGQITAAENAYVELLPEGLTRETVQKLQEHNAAFVAAGALAVGELAIPVMKKHKDIERTEVTIPTVGKDNFGFGFVRSRQVNVPGAAGEASTTQEVYGVVTAEFNMHGSKKVGELRKVKELLAAEALAAFGSK